MNRILFLIYWMIIAVAAANGQQLSADKLLDMSATTLPRLESQLLSKKYRLATTESSGDTTFKTYQYTPSGRGKKRQVDTVNRKCIIAILKETFTLTYQTTAAEEYRGIIETLKKEGFYCDYDKDNTVSQPVYLYQHEDYSAGASVVKTDGITLYCIRFFKKILSVNKELKAAEDLLDFTSHEYLVYYFGEKNVKKDIYYFAKNDIANCSVLFINTSRQVIFVWKDGLNRRIIDNLIFGGRHKLKSQEDGNRQVAENNWMLKSGARAGMSLGDLRLLNEKNIVFSCGAEPNPGLILPESTGKINFNNADVILGCHNCTDDKFLRAKRMSADKAIEGGRDMYVNTIALYPVVNGIFEY